MKILFDCHCEHSEAIQKSWIAAPLSVAREDDLDDFQITLVAGMLPYDEFMVRKE